jgi:hypothetical protein
MGPCDLAQFLEVDALAIGEFEAQRFAINLIALLAAGIFSVVVRGHFCLSKSLVSREISEVSSLLHSLPGRSAAGYLFFMRGRIEAELSLPPLTDITAPANKSRRMPFPDSPVAHAPREC